jgi:hypothetical protein
MDNVNDDEEMQHLGNELLDGDADYDEIEPGAPADNTSVVTEQKSQESENKGTKRQKGNLSEYWCQLNKL